MNDYYMYKCFCLRVKFDNCPRLLAPQLPKKRLSDIKYRQAKKIINNMVRIGELFLEYGVKHAKLFGPIVEGAASNRMAIDIWVEMNNYSRINYLEGEISEAVGHECNLTSHEEWLSFAHNYIDKGDQIEIFPNAYL